MKFEASLPREGLMFLRNIQAVCKILLRILEGMIRRCERRDAFEPSVTSLLRTLSKGVLLPSFHSGQSACGLLLRNPI